MTDKKFFPLPNRSIISVSGEDSQQFLQGLISNDISKVSETKTIYALLLTPQGKFLYDFFISQIDGQYLIDCHKDKIDKIIQKLSMYKLRSHVEIQNLSDKYEVAALLGNSIYENVGAKESGLTKQFCKGCVYVDPRDIKIFGRSVIEKENQYKSFHAYHFVEGNYKEYEELRISNCIPESEKDFFEGEAFPHDFAMDRLNAISYTKGCYVGQEVTARMHHRGTAKKKPYFIEAEDDLVAGEEIMTYNDKKLGYITSSIGNKAIALLNIEGVEAGGKQLKTSQHIYTKIGS